MIEWMNANSGFMSALLTAVYVIATIAILFVMITSNFLARKGLEQAIELERSRVRPYLSITTKIIKYRDENDKIGLPIAYLLLKNHGESQAYNVRSEINPLLYSKVSIGGKDVKKTPYFVENIISNIAPKQILIDSLGFTQRLFETYEKPIFNIIITYSDSLGKVYTDSYVINFAIMSNTSAYDDVFS